VRFVPPLGLLAKHTRTNEGHHAYRNYSGPGFVDPGFIGAWFIYSAFTLDCGSARCGDLRCRGRRGLGLTAILRL
jgi:hypothetical protein